MKLLDKLWNWGHLEGCHNHWIKMDCKMTPEKFAEEYGIKNAFIVSFAGNIQPPFDPFVKRFAGLREIKWSVLGDESTPIPEDELGNTRDVLAVADMEANITGGAVDDFFSPVRLKRFPPAVLKKIRAELNAAGKDFWCVLYSHQLDMDLTEYIDCFDGITFWIFDSEQIVNMDKFLPKVFSLANGKPVMLGIYFWDYQNLKTIPAPVFEGQVQTYFDLLKEKKVEGVIFCSNTIGDAGLETLDILKKYIAEQGNIEIE